MNQNPNSLIVYFNSVIPHLTQKQEIVLREIIKLGATSDEELAESMGVGINNISNRVGELLKLRLITAETNKINKRNKRVRVNKPNINYKINADIRAIRNRNLEPAQSPLPLSKVAYFVRDENNSLKRV